MENIYIGEKSWTETPELAMEKIISNFPKLSEQYSIGKIELSYLDDPKPHYQLGFVAELKGKEQQNDCGCIVYYPQKNVVIRKYNKVKSFPVNDWGKVYSTKRGMMTIVSLNNEAAVFFAKQFQQIK